MTLADYILYGIWFLFPLFYFVIAAWGKLERVSGERNRDDLGDYVRNGTIALAAVGIALAIDQFLLPSLKDTLLTDIMPYFFFRVMLYPVVFVLVNMALGPSKKINIEKSPRLDKYKRRYK